MNNPHTLMTQPRASWRQDEGGIACDWHAHTTDALGVTLGLSLSCGFCAFASISAKRECNRGNISNTADMPP